MMEAPSADTTGGKPARRIDRPVGDALHNHADNGKTEGGHGHGDQRGRPTSRGGSSRMPDANTSSVYPMYEPRVKKSPCAKLISFSTPYTMEYPERDQAVERPDCQPVDQLLDNDPHVIGYFEMTMCPCSSTTYRNMGTPSRSPLSVKPILPVIPGTPLTLVRR